MKLFEILDWIDTSIKIIPEQHKPESADILRRVNLANDEISRELRIPTRMFRDISPSGAFQPPVNARDDGLLKAYQQPSGREVPIYRSVEALASQHPNWDKSSMCHPAILFVHNNDVAPVVPVGLSDYKTLELVFMIRPDPLEDPSDEPFNTELQDFHNLIPLTVSMEYLVESAQSPEDMMFIRSRMYEARIARAMVSAFARASHPATTLGMKTWQLR